MTQNVIQDRPSNLSVFWFKYLREFVDSATALGIPDHTEVVCSTTWGGNVLSLRTDVRSDAADVPPAEEPLANAAHGVAVAEAAEKRTTVSQDSTGPTVQWRRWGRTFSAPTLTLADVRALVTRVDELRLPTERYVVRALKVSWSHGRNVYSISAGPLD